MSYKYNSKNEEDTIKLAKKINDNCFNNMIICLNGDLGSGKTLFTKAFANYYGIKNTITSPTFSIIKEYNEDNKTLVHMDVYRIEENEDIGITDYFNNDCICIIEWADLIKKDLPNERLELNFSIAIDGSRDITLISYGKKYEILCKEIFK